MQEGTKKTYKGEEWTVLYNNGSTVEIVSPSNIGTYKLGSIDPAEASNTGSDLDKTISSYNNAEQDYVRMCYWGVISSDNTYWLASHYVGEDQGDVSFGVRYANSAIDWDAYFFNILWYVSPSVTNGGGDEYGVRAIVTVDK